MVYAIKGHEDMIAIQGIFMSVPTYFKKIKWDNKELGILKIQALFVVNYIAKMSVYSLLILFFFAISLLKSVLF